MLKAENVRVTGWEAAIRGMRNPMNSWEKSDSIFYSHGHGFDILGKPVVWYNTDNGEEQSDVYIGVKDLELMKKLAGAGPVHGKFLRMINVTMDITAPLYWWKEFDTYKIGTVANSCSTMHKIHAKEFTMDDFSTEHLIGAFDIPREVMDHAFENEGVDLLMYKYCGFSDSIDPSIIWYPKEVMSCILYMLNRARDLYLETKDKKYWWQMIQLLPSSYNQKRTVQMNYQVLKEIYNYRHDHKLDEWHSLCDVIRNLPYSSELIWDVS